MTLYLTILRFSHLFTNCYHAYYTKIMLDSDSQIFINLDKTKKFGFQQ